jgi:hypothetical protein
MLNDSPYYQTKKARPSFTVTGAFLIAGGHQIFLFYG